MKRLLIAGTLLLTAAVSGGIAGKLTRPVMDSRGHQSRETLQKAQQQIIDQDGQDRNPNNGGQDWRPDLWRFNDPETPGPGGEKARFHPLPRKFPETE